MSVSELHLTDPLLIGNLIKQYRKEKQITQQQLADYSGLSRIGIVKLEQGKGDIKISTLITLFELLGFDLILRKRGN